MSNTKNYVVENVLDKKSEFHFCPLCQAPLLFLKISPSAHVAGCSIVWDNLPDCPDSIYCLNTSVFHYRDYAHSELAAYRSSNFYVSPLVETFARASPKKSPSKSAKNSSTGKIVKSFKTRRIKQSKSDNVCLNEENDNLLKNKETKAISSSRNKGQPKINVEKNLFKSSESDDESSFFKNPEKKYFKRSAASLCNKGTKALSKKIKTSDYDVKNDLIKADCSNELKINLEILDGIVNKVCVNYAETNKNKLSNIEEDAFPGKSSDFLNESLSGSFDISFDKPEIDYKFQGKDDSFSCLSKETKCVQLAESNYNRFLSYGSQEIDFVQKPSVTSSKKELNNHPISSTLIGNSILQSDKLYKLHSEVNEPVTSKTANKSLSLSSLSSVSCSLLESDKINEDSIKDVETILSEDVEFGISLKKYYNSSQSSLSSVRHTSLKSDKSNYFFHEISETNSLKAKLRNSLKFINNIPLCSSSTYSHEESANSDFLSSETGIVFPINKGSVEKREIANRVPDLPPKKKISGFFPKTERKCKLNVSESIIGEIFNKNEASKLTLLSSTEKVGFKISSENSASLLKKNIGSDGSKQDNILIKEVSEKNITEFCNKEFDLLGSGSVGYRNTCSEKSNGIISRLCGGDVKMKIGNNKGLPEIKINCNNSKLSEKHEVTSGNIAVGSDNVKNNRSVRQKSNIKKICPFYKCMPDTSIAVDAFNYGYIPGVSAYFLSHFHSDHYIGLKRSFNMPIFCSEITAKLVKLLIGVEEKWLNVTKIGERRVVCGTEVIAFDANHCPGSLMFLFQLKTGQNYLHVGDFRFSPKMETYPELNQLRIDKLYLDTTYCKPEYDFPSQETIVEEAVNIIKHELKWNSSLLVVCGSYLIGKEKIYSAIAEAYNYNIWVESSRKRVLKCIGNTAILERLVDKPSEAQIHVLPMKNISYDKLEDHLSKFNDTFKRIVAIRPTGWTTNNYKKSGSRRSRSGRSSDKIAIYEIPYSEHSSFSELRRFVQFLKPVEIIPTVNAGNLSLRNEMIRYFKSWLLEDKQPKQTSLLDFIRNK